MVSQGVVSQQLIKAAKSRDMAGCQEALQQGADVFATDQAESCVPKQTVQTSPRSLFYFQRKRHKWMQIMSVVPLLFSLGNCVRASTLLAKILLWPLFCHASWSPAQLWLLPVWIHRFALGGQSWFAGSLQAATREGCWCSAAEAAEDGKTGCLGYLKIQSTLNFSGLLWTCSFVSCLTS